MAGWNQRKGREGTGMAAMYVSLLMRARPFGGLALNGVFEVVECYARVNEWANERARAERRERRFVGIFLPPVLAIGPVAVAALHMYSWSLAVCNAFIMNEMAFPLPTHWPRLPVGANGQ